MDNMIFFLMSHEIGRGSDGKQPLSGPGYKRRGDDSGDQVKWRRARRKFQCPHNET
jgi:hypothetical protein